MSTDDGTVQDDGVRTIPRAHLGPRLGDTTRSPERTPRRRGR